MASRSRNSVSSAIEGVGDLISQIESYAVEPVRTKRKSRKVNKRNILSELDEQFWEFIRAEISRMLISNYNAIRVMNSPKYAAWKRKAQENGYSTQVLDDGTRAKVIYVRAGLLTGTLRGRLKSVTVSPRKINTKDFQPDSLRYTIDFSGLRNRYNEYFEKFLAEQGYDDVFVLREDQIQEILEIIVSKISEDL